MKVLFLSTRQAKPSFRFRVEKLLPYFENRQHACQVAFLPQSLFSRFSLYRTFADFDVVFIQKRLFSRWELSSIRRRARQLVYDIDDAVMFDGQGREDRRRRLRFQAMAESADLMICGNRYLADQSLQHSDRVVVIPTSIDTDLFHPRLCKPGSGEVTIGWTGSSSTNRYLNGVFPVLAQLAGKIRFRFLSDSLRDLDLKLLGDVPYEFVPWSPESEVSETARFQIGLMPLPDNPWTRGKCGFKALQYLALGIPAVCSPVGVNREIIEHGVNGFLAEAPESLYQILSRLVEEAGLRAEIGRAGRRRAEESYALKVQGPRTVAAIENLFDRARLSA